MIDAYALEGIALLIDDLHGETRIPPSPLK